MPVWLLVAIFAGGFLLVEGYQLARRHWRRRSFLGERARRLGGARQVVIPLSAGSGASWWLGKLVFWWWFGTLVAAVATMMIAQAVSGAGFWFYLPVIALSGTWLLGGLIAIVAAYLWPPSWRHLVFFGDRVQIRNGAGRMLLDTPIAEADVSRAYYRQNTGGKRNAIRYHPVIRIRGEGLGTMTMFCGEVSAKEPSEGAPRVRFPRVRVPEEHWPVLLEALSLDD